MSTFNELLTAKLNLLIEIQKAQLFYHMYKDLAMGEAKEVDVRHWGDKFEQSLRVVLGAENE